MRAFLALASVVAEFRLGRCLLVFDNRPKPAREAKIVANCGVGVARHLHVKILPPSSIAGYRAALIPDEGQPNQIADH